MGKIYHCGNHCKDKNWSRNEDGQYHYDPTCQQRTPRASSIIEKTGISTNFNLS
jgi:hypothetical protein